MKQRAVFLDRDGVINLSLIKDGKPYSPSTLAEFEIYPEVPEACRLLKAAGFLLVVVTNQPDVGRGIQSQPLVEEMHKKMCQLLPIDRVEVCYESGQEAYSEFRKPAPGMLLRAAQELNLDLKACFMVGDRWRDIDCGWAAGCITIFIERSYTETLRQEPNYRVANLFEAAQLIIELANNSSR